MSEKPRPLTNLVIHVEERRRPRVEDVHPCAVGKHRPAYLAAGGIACGYCGTRLG